MAVHVDTDGGVGWDEEGVACFYVMVDSSNWKSIIHLTQDLD